MAMTFSTRRYAPSRAEADGRIARRCLCPYDPQPATPTNGIALGSAASSFCRPPNKFSAGVGDVQDRESGTLKVVEKIKVATSDQATKQGLHSSYSC